MCVCVAQVKSRYNSPGRTQPTPIHRHTPSGTDECTFRPAVNTGTPPGVPLVAAVTRTTPHTVPRAAAHTAPRMQLQYTQPQHIHRHQYAGMGGTHGQNVGYVGYIDGEQAFDHDPVFAAAMLVSHVPQAAAATGAQRRPASAAAGAQPHAPRPASAVPHGRANARIPVSQNKHNNTGGSINTNTTTGSGSNSGMRGHNGGNVQVLRKPAWGSPAPKYNGARRSTDTHTPKHGNSRHGSASGVQPGAHLSQQPFQMSQQALQSVAVVDWDGFMERQYEHVLHKTLRAQVRP